MASGTLQHRVHGLCELAAFKSGHSLVAASVVICTHNPRPEYLRRVLEALARQTLPKERWELLLVDNASERPLSLFWDISWHPNARHVREDELGLTFARRRGVNEARGELIVFIDDDNVLAPEYLAHAVSIMQNTSIGALGGAGSPIFEEGSDPPPHFYNFATWLVCGAQLGLHVNVSKDVVDLTSLDRASLFGAGLIVRRADMLDLIRLPHYPILSDRKGAALSSGGDHEICHLIALKGKKLVYSAQLKFGHMIPSTRWDPEYLQRLASNTAHRQIIDTYVAARKFYAQGMSAKSLVRSIVKILISQNSRLERFELALLFENAAFAWPEDRPAFRNIRAVREQAAVRPRERQSALAATPA
jgi:glycosyltransferase involved in cell wall biosynthesis